MLFVFSHKDIACCLKQIKRFFVKSNATNCALYIFLSGGGGIEIEKCNVKKKSEGLK